MGLKRSDGGWPAKPQAPKGCGPGALEAALVGDVVETERLIKRGANVNVQDSFGQSVLLYAAWKGHVPLAELLISKMNNVEMEDNYKCTPLSTLLGTPPLPSASSAMARTRNTRTKRRGPRSITRKSI